MNRNDHIALLCYGVRPGGRWADLGCGSGAFSLALAELIGPRAEIFALDRDARSLRILEREMAREFPEITLKTVNGDFALDIQLPLMDGIILANTLHFQNDTCGVLQHVSRWLKPGGTLVLVEYDVTEASRWVPYPQPRPQWEKTATCAGLTGPRLIAERPSLYHGRVYSALAFAPTAS